MPICVVATGRNIINSNTYDKFLSSMNRQNYTNFKVYHVDDASTDYTTLKLFAEVSKKYPRLKSRLFFIMNENHIGASANKDATIK